MGQQEALVGALLREMELRQDFLGGATVETVYFGGGTPSLLSAGLLARLMEGLRLHFPIAADAEVTLEGNPDDLSAQKLAELKVLGINRLSIGIQSFDAAVLRWMNRAHSAKEALEVVDRATAAGFDRLSLDLIYGVPVGDKNRWVQDVERMVGLGPDHLSAYCLTIEPDTVFGRRAAKGMLAEVAEEQVLAEYAVLTSTLAGAGYEHYEVSNFALPHRYSRHNTAYWQQKPYLGLGPSAHSYNGTQRMYAVANNSKYVKTLQNDGLPLTVEPLTLRDQLNEYVLTSLRTKWGCNMEKIQKDFRMDYINRYANTFARWVAEGLAVWHESRIILTEKGLLWADGLAEEIFEEAEIG